MRVACVIQESLMDELDRLKKQQIIVPLGMDETSEWCNSFVLVLKANGKVWLCLDLARLNKVLIKPVHRGPILMIYQQGWQVENTSHSLMLSQVTITWNEMSDHHIKLYFLVHLADTDTYNYPLEQHQQVTCSRRSWMIIMWYA